MSLPDVTINKESVFNLRDTKVDGVKTGIHLVINLDENLNVTGTADYPVTVTVANYEGLNQAELLREILNELKKIEYHLYVASDTHLNDQDV